MSRLNQIINNHKPDFKRRCPTVENGTTLMTIQSMTCWLQVTLSCTTELLCLTQPINNSITIVTVINVYQFSKTFCSRFPQEHRICLFPPFNFKRQCIIQRYRGTTFLFWRYECTAPPSGHTQSNLVRFCGSLMLCVAQRKVCLSSTKQPSFMTNKRKILICIDKLFLFFSFLPVPCLFNNFISICILYLEGDTANRQVLVILQHAEILGHQGSSMDETHCWLCVTLPVVVLLCHVLKPGQTKVRRRLVALRNPESRQRRRVLLFSSFHFP